jgi:hypothetical protein
MREELEGYMDKGQNYVRVGDFIVYGSLIGRSASLRIGKVMAVRTRKKNYDYESGISISVLGVDDNRWGPVAPTLCERKGNLLFPERTMLANHLIPANIVALFDEAE